jgi:serine/threonine protein kinase
MEVWVLKREQFEHISKKQPGLLGFLSELVADRFDSRRPIADRTIGRYVATDIIGRGGFSIIYKGMLLGLNMPVAIKMMRHDLALDADYLSNFQNEAKTISSNVIIRRDDRLKILDFGLACPSGTRDFSSLGTIAYMAPEQIEGDPMDQRTDIYAVGITAFEMVVGKRPFPEDDAQALADMHLTHDIPDPAASAPDLPQDLQRFITKACQRNPNSRYEDMRQALADLRRIAQKTD